jgi:NADPH:quinone reductase-like Zn-dependent oxidoreductase
VAGAVAEVEAMKMENEVHAHREEVFAWCGRAAEGGGFAEYARAPRKMLVSKPATISFEQAAALPTSGVTAAAGRPGLGLECGQAPGESTRRPLTRRPAQSRPRRRCRTARR